MERREERSGKIIRRGGRRALSKKDFVSNGRTGIRYPQSIFLAKLDGKSFTTILLDRKFFEFILEYGHRILGKNVN